MLRRAQDNGFFDSAITRDTLKVNTDLDALRDRNDFKAWLKPLPGSDRESSP